MTPKELADKTWRDLQNKKKKDELDAREKMYAERREHLNYVDYAVGVIDKINKRTGYSKSRKMI